MIKPFILSGILILLSIVSLGNRHIDMVVAKDGSGDFTSLTEAINNLPMYQYQRFVILVKKGVYNEKIRLEQNNLTLLGESRDSTVIQYAQLRTDWIENKDFIGPAVINIHADDIILENLTIENTQPEVGPHAFTIYGTGTRTILLNCTVKSKGGDTVSLWNYKTGMYYHANCSFEGAVDFVCPRGWCYIRDSKFFELKETAAIWHAATENKDQKFVLVNCRFDGVTGYYLGRHHYEAQFYLLNCTFSKNMANKPIYFERNADPSKNRPYFWGDRHFFFNCKKDDGNYEWMTDNLPVPVKEITPAWTFDEKWDPESNETPLPTGYKIEGNNIFLYFKQPMTIRGELKLKTTTGKILLFKEGQGRDILRFETDGPVTDKELTNPVVIVSGETIVTEASVRERKLPSSFFFYR